MSQKKHRKYPDEFKQQALQLLATSGRTASDIERELDITHGLLSRWKRKADRQNNGATVVNNSLSLEEQVKQLKRENARLREEKTILKKAVSIFSHPHG